MAEKKVPNPVDIHVGSRIRMRRAMVGLSQEKLADRLGITFQQVQKYEKGRNRVGASRLQAISDILGAKPSYFFEGMENSASSSSTEVDGEIGTIDRFMASKDGLELNKAFVRIADGEVRKRVIGLVRALANVADDSEVTS